MTREELKNWELSEYNEDTEDQLDYYINERKCDVGDKAYLYSHDEDKLIEMEIIKIVCRSDDEDYYDDLDEDILMDGKQNAEQTQVLNLLQIMIVTWFGLSMYSH